MWVVMESVKASLLWVATLTFWFLGEFKSLNILNLRTFYGSVNA